MPHRVIIISVGIRVPSNPIKKRIKFLAENVMIRKNNIVNTKDK